MKKKNLFTSIALFSMLLGLASCTPKENEVDFQKVRFETTLNETAQKKIEEKLEKEIHKTKHSQKRKQFSTKGLSYNEETETFFIDSTVFELDGYKEKVNEQTGANFIIDELVGVQAQVAKTAEDAQNDNWEGARILSIEETQTVYQTYIAVKKTSKPNETLILDTTAIGTTQIIPIDIVSPLTEDALEVTTSHLRFNIIDFEGPYIRSHEEGPVSPLSGVAPYNSTNPLEEDLNSFRSYLLYTYKFYGGIYDYGSTQESLTLEYFKTLEDAQKDENLIINPMIFDIYYVTNPIDTYIRVTDKYGNKSRNIGWYQFKMREA